MTSKPTPPPFDGVVYQIYPRSFRDTTGDGVGDLAGITAELDHLAWLGVDALWLSPIYRSPMADFGYDVADHTDVDAVFGDLADLDRLIAAAHDRSLQVWLDWVPNHTSDEHPWFQASRSSRDDPKRDWYVWRDPGPDGGPPNNWVEHFHSDRPAWTLDEATGQYYLHQFLPQQPDLNWDHPDLRAAMHDVLRFWKQRGIDGFRADVVHLIGKDLTLPDDPRDLLPVGRAGYHDLDVTFDHLRGIREVLDEAPPAVMVGEVNLPDAARVVRYVGDDLLHLAFHFGLIYAPWEAASWRDTIRYVDDRFAEHGRWPAWVVGNHDQVRAATRLGSEAAARAAAVVLLTLRGVPFLYAGDEFGLQDATVPEDRIVDPGGRDGCRAPIPWTPENGQGWAGEPWLPWPDDVAGHDAASQRQDPASTLHLHHRLLAARRASDALRFGDQDVLDAHPDVLAFRRTAGDDVRVTVVSYATEGLDVEVADGTAGVFEVEVSTHRGIEDAPRFDGRLAPGEAVLLRPA
jgi:alpha-glucosidase